MRRKGRVQAGCDADVVVFGPDKVCDRATYSNSTRPSAGIRHVLVNGTLVVRDGDIVPRARPGQPVPPSPAETVSGSSVPAYQHT
jgi:N-acyl-D-aspartate/D-glutamate deacylase